MLNFFYYSIVEPFYDANMGGTIHTKMWAQRFSGLREQALNMPKFGTDTADEEVCNQLTDYIIIMYIPRASCN